MAKSTEIIPAEEAAEVVAPLSDAERTELQQLEQVVVDAARQAFQAGRALMEIRDRRLYRETHETFEAYVNDLMGVSDSHAYRWIDAAQVAANLAPTGVLPDRESHTRELVDLSPELQREAWTRAQAEAADRRLTAKVVQQARDDVLLDRIVAALEASDEPMTYDELLAVADVPRGRVYGLLKDGQDARRLHQVGGGWPERYAPGEAEYNDERVTVTIPADLVESAHASGKLKYSKWSNLLLQALGAFLDETR